MWAKHLQKEPPDPLESNLSGVVWSQVFMELNHKIEHNYTSTKKERFMGLKRKKHVCTTLLSQVAKHVIVVTDSLWMTLSLFGRSKIKTLDYMYV